jgi:hypothetical protein
MCQFRGDDSAFLPSIDSTAMSGITIINCVRNQAQEIINDIINGSKLEFCQPFTSGITMIHVVG